ncbi:MAG: FGGY-family carbohydrate kinase [Clostridiaceae bacterium]|nr:FGGY-family carbohydrate kinase [Clostridiaceae bacterium]
MIDLLGIDLGTSSVKLLLRHEDGSIEKAKCAYGVKDFAGWWQALVQAARQLDLTNVTALGLSSQVGTYLVDEEHIIAWSAPEGFTELQETKAAFEQSVFIREITMPHPDILSFPLPRLRYIRKTYPGASSICMPKDLLIQQMTGTRITDIYSWRGLADLEHGRYSRFFLDWLGIAADMLPPLAQPADCAGVVQASVTRQLGLPANTRVIVGCNDFFAGLLGMGVSNEGDLFDITGTSEHIGGIAKSALPTAPPVSGRYFSGFVRYGVTGSSGAAHQFGLGLYKEKIDAASCIARGAPLFLPYLNGERCPVCDPQASGAFVGIRGGCSNDMLAYAVKEGIAFNLRQILELLHMDGDNLLLSGGSAQDDELNQIKADILQKRVFALHEPDASAMGAMMLAGMGCGVFADMKDAIARCRGPVRIISPRDGLFIPERFERFKEIYPALHENFDRLRRNN